MRALLLAGVLAAAAPLRAGQVAVFVGTQGTAILGASLDTDTGRLVLTGHDTPVTRPTWLAIDPDKPVLYSVSELGNDGRETGFVCSFAIDRDAGTLRELSRVTSAGGGPTFLSYDPRVSTVFVANFGGGQVAAIPVNPDGSLLPPASVITDGGTLGPNPKQNLPHAHAAILDPGGHFVVTPDMGLDRIFVNRFDAASRRLSPADPPFLATEPGSGPRHVVFAPGGRFLYALIELLAQVRAYAWDPVRGELRALQALSLDRPEFKGVRSAGEIGIAADGRFLYATNRARSVITVFAVNRADGTLRPVQEIASGGIWPRSFNIDPTGRWLLVANQESKTLTVFRIDARSGRLTPAGDPISVPQKPALFAFVR